MTSDRCGFVVRPKHTVRTEPSQFGGRSWEIEQSVSCCWRSVWRGYDRCIWHVEVDEKPESELVASRTEGPECLDGAYLRGVELNSQISFSNCSLVGARFVESRFEHVDFSNATLLGADLRATSLFESDVSDACLRGVDLTNADLYRADLSNSDLFNAELIDSELERTDFESTQLGVTDFSEAKAWRADFTEASLTDATFTGANLKEATLTDTDLNEATLRDANLREATLTDADLTGATLTGCNLERATLIRTSLGNANMKATKLYDSQLRDVYVNESTVFEYSGYEGNVPDENALSMNASQESGSIFTSPWNWFRASWQSIHRWWSWVRIDPETRTNHAASLEKAVSDYRIVRRLHEENDIPQGIGTYTIKARETDRRKALIEHAWGRWLGLAAARWSSKYGESPRQIIYASLGVIGACTLLYPLLGGIELTPAEDQLSLMEPLETPLTELPGGIWLASLYFSTVTFTTLGYGDASPGSAPTQFLAGLESLMGSILMALLVAVLVRRITR